MSLRHAGKMQQGTVGEEYLLQRLKSNSACGCISGVGRGNVRRTTSSILRKQIIQKLQTGDLADLADEGMSMLLPHLKRVGNSTSPASAEWAAHESGGVQNTHYRAGNPLHPKINYRNPKNWSWPGGAKVHTQDNGSVLPAYWKYWQTGISNPRDDKWSFRTLEQHIRRGLKSSQTEREVANAISEVIFPELNLRSYLEGRSVLTVPTIRNIIRSRHTEEAAELDRALTKAAQGPIKIPAPFLTHPANLKQKAKFLMNQAKLGQSVTQANAIGPALSYRHEMED
ncbi:uncharacterized protein LOC117428008 [Acipenser ruthenus]|uniref:uncharacterized protein LOC117428008 n=1 Tax=Acipenser ruthenus TaxID=7906 RepID=UPI00145B2A58|nr:uncharacterized protein LOC117428008 [Acipenser ruthenus]